ncbi:diguanylate cyclase [Thiocystis violacea]|uniref:diguanylate cyclase n=1 Tax=Thiocystis violacea TaxID=13725 RepID=UPI0019081135|nr:diguanylate cyclase [Thiocystis violacea]MBK1724368.1 diguanylate cyclase [Thiocystis violacea]
MRKTVVGAARGRAQSATHTGCGAVLAHLTLLCVALCAAAPALALDSVTLQLKWRHQFQFAGYYMALEKGYYRDAGLDVRFLEAGPNTDPVAEVISGAAQFGIGSSELLLSRQTYPVVALAPIFQHSPFELLVRADRASNLHELVGQPIMLEAGAAEILALFQKEGVERDKLVIHLHSLGVDALLHNQVAAISAYSTTEPYLLRQADLDYNEFSARAGGIDFYGDILFTTESELKSHPERARAFLAASLEGWQYAMAHIDESIDLIMAKYNSQDRTRAHYRFEAEETRSLMQPDLVVIGHVNPGRWRHIADTYAALGMLPEHFPLDGFLYAIKMPRFDPRLLVALALALAVALMLGLLSWRVDGLNRRLRGEIAQRKAAHHKLAESEALHRLLTENSGDVIWMLDLVSRRFDYVSPSVQRLRGFTPEEVMAQPLEKALTPQSAKKVAALIGETLERLLAGDTDAGYVTAEVDQPHRNGGIVPTEVVTTYLMDEAGRPVKILGVTRDISQRKALEAELRTRVAAIEAAADAIVITDTQGYLLYANPAFTLQTGYDLESVKGQHSRILNSGKHPREFYAQLWQTALAGQIWRGELINRRKNGEFYEEEMTISPVKKDHGEIECFVAIKRDISEQRAMERALQAANQELQENLEKIGRLQVVLAEQAIRDPLTGLYNRRYLDETLPREFARAKHEGYSLTVAMLDVDFFKRINDTWGHPAGDEILKALAQRLSEGVREGDIVCRYGGEEFLLVLPHIAQEIAFERAERLRLDFADSALECADTKIQATLSIGLASYPDHAQTPDALIEQADAALYRAKRSGRNRTEIAPAAASGAITKG